VSDTLSFTWGDKRHRRQQHDSAIAHGRYTPPPKAVMLQTARANWVSMQIEVSLVQCVALQQSCMASHHNMIPTHATPRPMHFQNHRYAHARQPMQGYGEQLTCCALSPSVFLVSSAVRCACSLTWDAVSLARWLACSNTWSMMSQHMEAAARRGTLIAPGVQHP
jgi:hypothetical protein